jgi:hypothetical protein
MSWYIQQLMERFQSDETLLNGVDLLIAESPRTDIELDGPNKTILSVYDKIVVEDRWLSVYRDVVKSTVTITIEVLSSNGDTDAYCDNVIIYLVGMLEDLTTMSDTGWYLHINSLTADVVPERPGRWKGSIVLNAFLFENY